MRAMFSSVLGNLGDVSVKLDCDDKTLIA
jgi:hypothetical protein